MKTVIGIDVGKFELETYIKNKSLTLKNNDSGIKKFLRLLSKENKNLLNSFIIFEATGGYECLLKKKLEENNIPYHMAHPNKVRAFAKAKGLLAKTDKIDAKLLANYGDVMKPTADLCQDNAEIKELLKRREQLLEEKNREKNRSDKELNDLVRRSIKKHLKWLDNEIDIIEKQLKQLSKEDSNQNQMKLLTSIPGIGDLTAMYILSYLPEIKTANKSQLAALTGIAPMNYDSGSYRGKRFIQGGRAPLRKALYMSAVPSIKFNMQMKRFYERLRANGKTAKVALVGVMRKLLLLAASIIKRGTPWVYQDC